MYPFVLLSDFRLVYLNGFILRFILMTGVKFLVSFLTKEKREDLLAKGEVCEFIKKTKKKERGGL